MTYRESADGRQGARSRTPFVLRSRLEPIKRVARLIKYYWDGVINAATTYVTNARSEGLNSKIQWVKRMACGYLLEQQQLRRRPAPGFAVVAESSRT